MKPISLFPGKVKLISLFCFLVAAGFAGCDKKPDLSRAPAIVAPRGWQAPAPLSRVTASGARVVLVPDHKLPLVHLMVTVQAGAELDPPDKPGLAVATANFLVDGGAGARSGRELAEAFEELGGELKIECDETGLRLSTPMLARNLDRALALVADLVARPRFDAAEWPSARDRQLAEIVRRRDEPRDAADTVFQRVLYGAHPYAHDELGTRAAVEKLTADDVRAFYAAHYGPRTTQVLLVGDAQLDDVAARLDAALAGWKSSAAPAPPPPDAAPSGARFVLVDRPGAPQSEVRVGHVGIARATPDYAAACLVEMILGGSFTSRLVQNLREKHGYTYGVHAEFKAFRAPGPFIIATAVRTDATAESVREILAEVSGMRAPIPLDELQKGRALVEQKIVESWGAGPPGLLLLSDLTLADQPLDSWSRLPAQLEHLDAAQLDAAAARLLHPDALTVVVVGDRKLIEHQLRALPIAKSIEYRDLDGEPLPPR
ncbi:MAG TPA: pitrilysin family protein [Polyangia bacterium]|nr:pitrilysin family protein [Polyangia bacterium]